MVFIHIYIYQNQRVNHIKNPHGFFPAKTTGPPLATNSEVFGNFRRRRSAKPETQVLGAGEGIHFSNQKKT